MSKSHRVMAVRFKFKKKYVEVITMGKSPRGTPFIYQSVKFPRETTDQKKRHAALKQAVEGLMTRVEDV